MRKADGQDIKGQGPGRGQGSLFGIFVGIIQLGHLLGEARSPLNWCVTELLLPLFVQLRLPMPLSVHSLSVVIDRKLEG